MPEITTHTDVNYTSIGFPHENFEVHIAIEDSYQYN